MTIDLDAACFHGGAFFDAVGDSFDDLSRRHQIINADVLDAWFPPAPGVLRALHDDVGWIARTSPPTMCGGLRMAIANARYVPAANILVGAGSSALIFLALREWLTSYSRVLLLDPCYGEYGHVLERVIGCRVDRIPLRESDGWMPDIERIAARLRRGYDLFVLVNPNNPTGGLVSRGRLAQLLRRVPRRTRVWIDEAYIDYADASQSMERVAADSANVFVCKSLSKVYALSGMRVAYLCGPADAIAALRRLTPPWAVSLPGQIAAVHALADPEYYARRYRETAALRDRLAGRLRRIPGVRAVTGAANFLLCHLDDSAPDVTTVLDGCRGRGVYVRDVSSMGRTLSTQVFRTAVKGPHDNARIVTALAEALGAVVPEMRDVA